MPLVCGYTFTDEEPAIEDVWHAWESDPCGVAVCTAPMSVAHRHAVAIGACGGFARVRVESTPGGLAAFVQRFDADTQRGMFALDRDGAPLDDVTTVPFFTARHVEDLVVLVRLQTSGSATTCVASSPPSRCCCCAGGTPRWTTCCASRCTTCSAPRTSSARPRAACRG